MKYKVSGKPAQIVVRSMSLNLAPGESLTLFYGDGTWFGQGHRQPQHCVLNREEFSEERFAVNNIQSPIWLCSSGAAVLAETTATLKVKSNLPRRGRLVITCPDSPVTFRIFIDKNLPRVHAGLLAHLRWPPPSPPRATLADPIFCTWTQYPRRIDRGKILAMAKEIRRRGFPCTTITIDDRWEASFGSLEFGPAFPRPAEMVRRLHKLGFRVLLWVTPFVNKETAAFGDLERAGFLVMAKEDQKKTSLFRWWGGEAGLIDLTSPRVSRWFSGRLRMLKKKYGVDGFKIDGGDGKYQPDPATSDWHAYAGPSGYSDKLLSVFEKISPHCCESRTAWLSQGRKIIWRQGGKDSDWGPNNGLQALIRLGITMSLLGYDLFMPDMIPGRVQTLVSSHPLPTDELTVRWTEVSAFMPVMQFSYFPWN